MTKEEFIKWVDGEVDSSVKYNQSEIKSGFTFTAIADAKIQTLKKVKEKYLSILPPPQSTN